ncbi:MAG TPA: hypothetical protein VJV78_00250 [Polyangiales bacterium]|nr:hypothetical protein [Polyangiales bacterium]
MLRLIGVLCGVMLGAGCQGNHDDADAGAADAGDVAADGGVDAGDQVGGLLQELSLKEAPAPRQRFYWGAMDVTAPGKAGDGRDTFTIALDEDNTLRYLSWKTLPHFPKTFGDAKNAFPVAGSKQVDTHPDYLSVFDVTVEGSPTFTATRFELSMRVVGTDPYIDGITDYVESTSGERNGQGWDVSYSAHGKFRSAVHDVDARGTLYTGDPNAPAPSDKGSVWSAPVELEAPGSYGPPFDHMTVELGPTGQPRSFDFEKFRGAPVTFGSGQEDIPLSGTATRRDGDLRITVDDAVAATRDHFVIRYHAVGNVNLNGEQLSDYVEGLDGTRFGDTLVVRYFLRGRVWGATMDAHAAGTLAPASPNP